MSVKESHSDMASTPEPSQQPQASPERERQAEERLAAKFGIHSEFVRVPTLAKIMAMSSNSIYVQMRKGSFPIEHRRVGTVVLVKLADLARWYCEEPPAISSCDAHETAASIEPDDSMEPTETTLAPRRKETPKQRMERIKREVIAKMAATRAANRHM